MGVVESPLCNPYATTLYPRNSLVVVALPVARVETLVWWVVAISPDADGFLLLRLRASNSIHWRCLLRHGLSCVSPCIVAVFEFSPSRRVVLHLSLQ